MSLTLSAILERFGKELEVRSHTPITTEVRNRRIRAVNFTNLLNPAPFLVNQTLILTTGHLLEQRLSPFVAQSYVRNLMIRDVPAVILGPEQLDYSRKANQHALESRLATADYLTHFSGAGTIPILISYDLSFIEMTRVINSMLAEDLAREDMRIANARRRLNMAAFSSTSLEGVTQVLADLLGTWVACFDNNGSLVGLSTQFAAEYERVSGGIPFLVQRMLIKGVKATNVIQRSGGYVCSEAFGVNGNLSGVLVRGRTGESSDAAAPIISHAIFLLEALLHGLSKLQASEQRLNASVLRMLLQGSDLEDVRRVCISPDDLPTAPIIVVCLSTREDAELSSEDIQRVVSVKLRGRKPFIAQYHDHIFLVMHSRDYPFTSLFPDRICIGVSSPHSYQDFAVGCDEAEQALLDAKQTGRQVVKYQPMHDIADVFDFLMTTYDNQHVEHEEIAALRKYDALNGTHIAKSLTTWLNCNGSWSRAAAELGIHRHTLEHHIAKAADVMQLDLHDTPTRIALWFALQKPRQKPQQKPRSS